MAGFRENAMISLGSMILFKLRPHSVQICFNAECDIIAAFMLVLTQSELPVDSPPSLF